MGKSFVGNSSSDLLSERYPELIFLLNFSSPYEAFLEEEFIPEFKAVEVFYIYGIGGSSAYPSLKKWVLEKKNKKSGFLRGFA